MLEVKRCPFCGNFAKIEVVIQEYGFNGVIIRCENCGGMIRNAKCTEMIKTEQTFSTPITQESLGKCLWETIEMWNRRHKK